ncbi:hypothetical protein [Streptomyces sp. NPDC056647]|uniref:hypothetical protein n=1 Tax=unclassified Streptomyces TaxID=2593676 RepID=UPI0036BEDB74
MTRVTRSLPVLAPGSVEAAFVIQGYDEVVAHDTVWGCGACGEARHCSSSCATGTRSSPRRARARAMSREVV